MSRLVRLYPPAWRDRYLAELEDLLADRPPTVRDRVDIVRGALDAWIHPQVASPEPRPDEGPSAGRRIAAGGAIVAGGLWIAAGLSMNAAQVIQGLGYKDATMGVILVAGGALVSALVGIALALTSSRRSRATTIAALAMLIGAALIFTPWPYLVVGIFGYAFATVPFGLLLARAEDQAFGGLLPITAIVMLFMNTEDERALLTIPFGLAWIAIGLLTLRRAPAGSRVAITPA